MSTQDEHTDEGPCCECGSTEHVCQDCPTFQGPITRLQYIASAGDQDSLKKHRAYYAQFVNESTKLTVVSHIGADRLRASIDIHFNDIPLGQWDTLAGTLPHERRWKELGDYPTLAGWVCIAKEAARQWLDEQS